MSQYQWDNELRQWIDSSRNINNDLAESYIKFFSLVFENTSCPDQTWFGILDHAASLVVGNIYLAAIIRRGKKEDKGIWLLLQSTPDIDGWQSWNKRSRKVVSSPLRWFHTPFFEKVVDVLDNSGIWRSYQIASARILDFPVAANRDNVQEIRGKLRLNEIYSPSKSPLDEIEEYCSSYEDLPETERRAVIQSRLGQGKFRTDLIHYWGGCAVTGCKEIVVLRASHIKPWRKADNNERLDVYNGLLLSPNLDAAFDNGLITFDKTGKIIVSSLLQDEDREKLGIHSEMYISKLETQHIKYLDYHREKIFKWK